MTDPAPYRLAARAAAFVAMFAVVLLAADLALGRLARRGVRVVPKLPPAEMTRLLDAEGKVLVLGDSVMTYLPKDDVEPTLVEKLAAELPVGVHDASHRGRGAAFAAAEIDTVVRANVRPAVVVVEVNLANLSPVWEENPGMQNPDLVLMLRTGMSLPIRAATVFKHRFGLPTEEEFVATPVWIGGRESGVIGERSSGEGPAPPGVDPEERVRRRALIRYATDLERSWTLPLLTRAIGNLVSDLGVPCVAFVTPIDVANVRRVLGADDFALVERKIDALRRAIEGSGIRVLDLSAALPSSAFVHPAEHFDEHLSPEGRAFVAAKVAALVKEALPPR